MKVFLLLYLVIYGALHAYFYFRIQSAFILSLPLKVCMIGFLAFMVVSPVLIRLLERLGQESAAYLFATVGYLWMGLIFIFFSAALLLEIYRILLWCAGRIGMAPPSCLTISEKLFFCIPFVVALIINAFGYHEARQIRTEHITLHSEKIPAHAGRIRIVQISDIHVGMMIHGERLSDMMSVVRDARPDILVSTGDLVDGQRDSLYRSVELLKSISPPYGKFAVLGNHEFYAGLNEALRFTSESGFRVLRGEAVTVGNAIRIAGVDDPAGRQMGSFTGMAEKDLLASPQHPRLFTVLLKHQPIVHGASLGAFDLQLSGHTHKGQIFPFNFITQVFFPFHSGYYRLAQGSVLYVSRGTGTWGPPVRFLSPPEVTIIDLVRE